MTQEDRQALNRTITGLSELQSQLDDAGVREAVRSLGLFIDEIYDVVNRKRVVGDAIDVRLGLVGGLWIISRPLTNVDLDRMGLDGRDVGRVIGQAFQLRAAEAVQPLTGGRG